MKKATLLAGLFAFVLAISVSAQEPVKEVKKETKKVPMDKKTIILKHFSK